MILETSASSLPLYSSCFSELLNGKEVVCGENLLQKERHTVPAMAVNLSIIFAPRTRQPKNQGQDTENAHTRAHDTSNTNPADEPAQQIVKRVLAIFWHV